MKASTIIMATVVLGLVLYWGWSHQGIQGQPAPKIGPGIWIHDGPASIETGNDYLIEFWATWCPPCRESIPHLAQLEKQCPELHIISIASYEHNADRDKVKTFVQQEGKNMDYPVLFDPTGATGRRYTRLSHHNTIPDAYLVNWNQEIVWSGNPLTLTAAKVKTALKP